MRRIWIVVGLLVVAVGGYLLFGSRTPTGTATRGPNTPDEEEATEAEGTESTEAVPPSSAKGGTRRPGTAGRSSAPKPYSPPRRVPPRPAPRPQTGPREYQNDEHGLKVRKPAGWIMSTDPERFFIREPGKVVEMHRNLGDADPRFATLFIYAVQGLSGSDGGQEVSGLERLDKRAPISEFKVQDERKVAVGTQQMIRRVTLWNGKGRETKFLSVRCRRGRMLYVLLAFTAPDTFDAFLPEFEAVINSLTIE